MGVCVCVCFAAPTLRVLCHRTRIYSQRLICGRADFMLQSGVSFSESRFHLVCVRLLVFLRSLGPSIVGAAARVLFGVVFGSALWAAGARVPTQGGSNGVHRAVACLIQARVCGLLVCALLSVLMNTTKTARDTEAPAPPHKK